MASAATAIVAMMVIAVLAATVATAVSAVSATAAAATTASLTAQAVDHGLYLVVGCLAAFEHTALELQRLTGQRVVQVHLHLVVADVEHAPEKAVAVGILQRNYCILEYMLVVKMAVDANISRSKSSTWASS